MSAIKAAGLLGLCSLLGCAWSEPHRRVYADCMESMQVHEQKLIGNQGTLLPEGVDKSDYCWEFARKRFRALQRSGLLVGDSR